MVRLTRKTRRYPAKRGEGGCCRIIAYRALPTLWCCLVLCSELSVIMTSGFVNVGSGRGAASVVIGDRSTERSRMMKQFLKREPVRMPSSEPVVTYKEEGLNVESWLGINGVLLRLRTILVGSYVDDTYANKLIAQLVYLEKESNTKPVKLLFNCPGADLRAALAVYDTMQHLEYPILTTNLSLATGMVAFLIAGGTVGMRHANYNARFLLQRTGIERAIHGQSSDIAIEAAHMLSQNEQMELGLSKATGNPVDRIHSDLKRDFYLSSEEAIEYGLIDKAIMPLESKLQRLDKDHWYVEPYEFGHFRERGQRHDEIKVSLGFHQQQQHESPRRNNEASEPLPPDAAGI